MSKLPLKVEKSLEKRKNIGSFRELRAGEDLVDFSSNDYLGFAGNKFIFEAATRILEDNSLIKNGSGGSRLLTGNHLLYPAAEDLVASYHKAEAALIFNSGYDANLGFFSAIPGRGDLIMYDEFIHASIRDGIKLSAAKAHKFAHNDLEDLHEKIERVKNDIFGEVYIVTESIFSMDGDKPDLKSLIHLAEENNYCLIVDEAHAVGVHGAGLVAEAGLEQQVFARIITFGKALGSHGAAIFGSKKLKDFLINYARSFIYSTALPPHAIATLMAAYRHLQENGASEIDRLSENITFFKTEVSKMAFKAQILESDTAIQCILIPGNSEVKIASEELRRAGFDVRPILSPTVSAGTERLRICLHSFNTREEINMLLNNLSKMTFS